MPADLGHHTKVIAASLAFEVVDREWTTLCQRAKDDPTRRNLDQRAALYERRQDLLATITETEL